jgi:serine/threonine protein kinase
LHGDVRAASAQGGGILDGRVARKPESLEGTRIGSYALGKLLGSGGMGHVYRATREEGGAAVALKVLAPELGRDPKAVERFEREAEAVQRLDHPNVIRIVEIGRARGHHFIAMELITGPSFRRMIEDGDEPARILGALAQVAGGLAHAHARGIIHRDIKPDIADFGLARVEDAASMTSQGQVVGTVKYISPEQAQGKKATAASDVYSFGVMLYEAITGDLPFASETQHGFIFKHASEAPPRPELRAGFPAPLARLALDCLHKDVAARPTMDDVARRLAASLEWRAPRRWKRWLAAAALVGAVGVWLGFPQLLEPVSDGWFGAPAARALRDASLAVRGALP